MSECVEISYDVKTIDGFMTYVLNMELCSLFLPVSFVISDRAIVGQYKTAGFEPLSDMETINVCRALDMMISVLKGMIQAQRRCVFPEDYHVRLQDAWFSGETGEARLVFMPAGPFEQNRLYAELLLLHDEMTSRVPEEGRSYMKTARSFISRGKSSLEVIRHRFEELRREAMLCGMDANRRRSQ